MQNIDVTDIDDERYGSSFPDYETEIPLEDEDDPYQVYGTANRHAVKTYKQALEGDWLDDSLRDLLETRVEELTQRR